MNANQSTNAPETPPPRAWVWHCTDESIAAGQISVLAVIETLAAVALYWWLSFRFEWPWFSMVGLIAAPILLLRSEKSVALGVNLLRQWVDRRPGFREQVSIFLIMAVAVGFAAYFPAQSWLNDKVGWSVYWQMGIIFSAAILLAGVGITACQFNGARTYSGMLSTIIAFIILLAAIKASFGIFIFALVETLSGTFGGVWETLSFDILLCLIALLCATLGTVGFSERFLTVVMTILFGLTLSLGGLLHALFIRWFATLRYFFNGLQQLPHNWRENLGIIDFTHAPELLPQASKVSKLFSIAGLRHRITNEGGIEKVTLIVLLAAWYFPALAYRWSLKASAWLWWPLALALTPPFEGLDGYARRDRAAIVSRGAWSKLLLFGLTVLVPWLLLSWHPAIKDLLAPVSPAMATSAETLLKLFPPPPMGLRYGLLWLAMLLGVVLAWYSHNLLAAYDKVLGSPRGYSELTPQEQQRFETQARPVERLRLWLIVVLFLLGEAVALVFAHDHNPAEIERLVWPWLLEWL